MADKQMNQFTTATDGAYIYAEAADGSQVKIAKAHLTKAIGGLTKFVESINDLNNMLAPGYYTPNNIQGEIQNCPVTDVCLVITLGIEGLYVIQWCHQLNGNSIYYRKILPYIPEYGQWVRIN